MNSEKKSMSPTRFLGRDATWLISGRLGAFGHVRMSRLWEQGNE